MLVSVLSRAIADRVMINDITLGRKGLLGYLKALGGSNIVKVIPSNGSASGSQATVKKLKVICGANTSYLADGDWIGDKTPLTLCDDLKGVANALKRAKRARVSFEPNGSLDGKNLILDTELIRYKWQGVNVNYPDYEKLIPTDFNCQAHYLRYKTAAAVLACCL